MTKPAVSGLTAALFALGSGAALALVAFPLGAPLGGRALDVAAALLVSAICGAILGLHVYVAQPRALDRARRLAMLAVVVALSAAMAKLFLSIVVAHPQRRYLAYLLPLAASPMLVAALLDAGVAVAVAAVLPVFTAFVGLAMPGGRELLASHPLDALQMTAVFLFGSLAGLFLVHRADRWGRFLLAGGGVAAVSLVTLLAFWFLSPQRQATDIAWIVIASALSGLLSAVIAIGGPVVLGPLFGVDTRMQLMALAQLNHPLLRKLQEEAPGTFHHSVIVGNLSERAADVIGADSLLVRVGCYFHDIGKTLKPAYYIENQNGGASPYDGLDPAASARMVTDHVRGGVDLARRHHVPERVRAFIPEHHGTRLVTYFYRKAAAQDPKTDPEAFRYPGPRPQSRETAIVMMADSVEAVVRSSKDRSPERIDALVRAVIGERVSEGQFDECALTLADLKAIGDSFVTTLRGVYHARIDYPKPMVGEKSTIATALTAPPAPLPAPMDGTAPPVELKRPTH